MKTARVDEGMWQVLYYATTDNVSNLAREELLDKPLDVNWLCSTYNTMRNSLAKTFHTDVGNSGAVMRELFDISFDGRGNAVSNWRRSVDYKTLIAQAIKRYETDWKAYDYERWLYEQFEKEHERWMYR